MIAIAKKEGFADLAAFRASLKTNPKYVPTFCRADRRRLPPLYCPDGAETSGALHTSSEVAGHRRSHTRLPVRRCNPLRDRHSGRQAPRPRRRCHSNFAERSLIDDEAIAYHEGVPGHHMQLSVAAATDRVAEVPPAWSRLQCVHRRVGFVRRATR